MATAFNLEGFLGLNTTRFKNKLKEADGNLKTFKARSKKATMAVKKSFKGITDTVEKLSGMLGIGGAISGAGLAALTVKATRAAEEIGQLAQTTGSTVKEVQALTMAFRENNLEADDVGDVLNTIADRAQDAKDGMQSFIDDFALVGLEVDDLRGKRPAELFDTFADAVANTEDPVKRQSAIVRILGDDLGRKLAPALLQGSTYFARLAIEAERAGLIMDAGTVQGAINASRAMERLKTIIDAGVNKVFAQMGPFIELAAQKLVNFINSGADFDKIFNRALSSTVKVIGFVADAVNGLSVTFKGLKVVAFGFATAFTGVINGILKLTMKFANAVKDFMFTPLKKVLELASKLPIVGDEIRKVLNTIEDFEFKPPQIVDDAFNASLEGLTESTKEFKEALAAPVPSESLNQWVEGVELATAKMKESANTAEAMRVNVSESAIEIGEEFKKLSEQTDEFGRGMRSALGTEVQNALNGDFANIGDSFKQLMQRMVADAIAADIANAIGLGGAPSGGSQGGNFLAGAGSFFGIPGFANGGNPPINKAAIVGERGPELIVPRQASTVIPNDELQRAGGGQQIVNNFNISTPDAQSFRSSRSKITNDINRAVR